MKWGGAAARPRDENFLREDGGGLGRLSLRASVTLGRGPKASKIPKMSLYSMKNAYFGKFF